MVSIRMLPQADPSRVARSRIAANPAIDNSNNPASATEIRLPPCDQTNACVG
jgi:hypothetical protein